MTSTLLSFEAGIVRVVSADPQEIRWLEAFLECGFEPASARPSLRVRMIVSAGKYDALLERGSALGPVEAFAKDAEPKYFERWGPRTYHDPSVPAFFGVFRSGSGAVILARERTPKTRRALMRVTRELAMGRIVAAGDALVHGAAVRSGGRVLVLSGPRRSGKTTLLLALLRLPGVDYVANDRCVLGIHEWGASIRGIPSLVSIRQDGPTRFPELAGLVPPEPVGRRPGFSVSPPELCAHLGCGKASGGPAAAFVFPRITDRRGLSLRRLSEPEALERFRAGLFRAAHPTILGAVFSPPGLQGPAPWEAAAPAGRWIARNLPCYDCELGGDGPPAAEACAELIALARR